MTSGSVGPRRSPVVEDQAAGGGVEDADLPPSTVTETLLEQADDPRHCVEWLDRLIDASPVSMVVVDEQGRIRAANRTATELFGRSREELSGELLGRPGTPRCRVQLVAADGQLRTGELTACPVPGTDLDLVTIEDRTAQTQLDEVRERLDILDAVIGHDLREPLRMIESYLELVDERVGDRFEGEVREFLDFARDGAERLDTMLAGLREYTRAAHGETQLEPVDLDATVEDVVANLALTIEHEDAEVRYEDLPRVLGDRQLLTQLFQNLVANAIDHRHPDRAPVVEVRASRATRGWRIDVEDNGAGIPEDDRERVFGMFQRPARAGTDDRQGTGMGLAICEAIARRHGTRIDLESQLGEGSVFSIVLPAAGTETALRGSPTAARDEATAG